PGRSRPGFGVLEMSDSIVTTAQRLREYAERARERRLEAGVERTEPCKPCGAGEKRRVEAFCELRVAGDVAGIGQQHEPRRLPDRVEQGVSGKRFELSVCALAVTRSCTELGDHHLAEKSPELVWQGAERRPEVRLETRRVVVALGHT